MIACEATALPAASKCCWARAVSPKTPFACSRAVTCCCGPARAGVPTKRWFLTPALGLQATPVGARFRCGTADLLEVCDVKEQLSQEPRFHPPTEFSVQPRIPAAASSYCTTRANFALPRRPSFVENSIGK